MVRSPPRRHPVQTEVVQANEPGTLRQNLRDLKVADATVQLENLAREVGIDLTTWKELPLAECEGQIVSAFRDVKSVYERLRSDLVDAADRLDALGVAIDNSPPDFRYPNTIPPLQQLRSRPDHIHDLLEDTRNEEVERLRSAFEGPSRHGNFQPLMAQARSLLEEPRNALTTLVANVQSLENAVTEYRQRLLATSSLQAAYRGLEALAVACGDSPPYRLTLKDIEAAGALSTAAQRVQAAVHEASVMGSSRLSDTPVSFDRWCAIVRALDAGRDPRSSHKRPMRS
jgi:uncharacterized protein YukE